MQEEKIGRQWILIMLIVGVIIFGYCSGLKAGGKDDPIIDSLYAEIKAQDILFPEIVLRQAIQETGWFNCTKCSWRYNNPFGFRYKTWVTETNPKGYIQFQSWKEAVNYYKRWQAKFYKEGDYYDFLTKRGYAEDKGYIARLKSLKLWDKKEISLR